VHAFSPLMEQRFVMAASPLVSFDLGFEAMKGDITDVTSKSGKIWKFFNDCQGRSVSFWYFDPVPWSRLGSPWRDDPTTRTTHPTEATRGRYIALFDEDELSVELFEWKLRKAQLKISGYPG
jgi:hypothetical protein